MSDYDKEFYGEELSLFNEEMTTERALEVLDTIPTKGEQVDALEMAIKALKKQLPKECEVITQDTDVKIGSGIFKKGTRIYKCVCDEFIAPHHKYCPECGQRISIEREDK